APVLRWSADKHYLRDLERLGVPVVATTFVEPGADARETLGEFLEREVCAELVVKPAVGAGSRDTRRHARAASAETLAHLRPRVDLIRDAAGKPCLLELELAEPSLFFAHEPRAAVQLAAATLAWCAPAKAAAPCGKSTGR